MKCSILSCEWDWDREGKVRMERLSLLPLKSLLYFALGTAGVLLLVLFGLRPLQASLYQLDEETGALKARLEQQRELAPLYRDFTARLSKDEADRLPAPDRTGLSLEQVVAIPGQFQKLAQQSNLETIAVAPEVKSFTRDRKFMPVNLILKGRFLKFRRFLMDLERLPCLEHIEEIQIQETAGAQEFRLKVWVAVNPQKSN